MKTKKYFNSNSDAIKIHCPKFQATPWTHVSTLMTLHIAIDTNICTRTISIQFNIFLIIHALMQWRQQKSINVYVCSLRCPLPPSDKHISIRVFCKRTTVTSNHKKQTNGISDLYMYTL